MPTPPSEFRYPCEQCGGSLTFSPGEQSLKCPYCGHIQQIGPGAARAPARSDRDGADGARELLREPATGRALQWDAGHKVPQLREIPLDRGLRLDTDSDLTQQIRTLSCPNCGARFELEAERHSALCPFCATPVVTDTGATRQIKPQGVVPFVVTEEQAHAALEDWLGRLWFAPSGLVKYARKGRKMAGVYSPFWTFDADTVSEYSGQRGDWYYETRWVTQMVDGKRRRVQQRVRKTRWRAVRGRVSRSFNDVLVLASSALPRRITDALTPWDLSHLRPYSPQYLQGFEAEGYTIPLDAGHDIARQEMAAVITMDIRRDIGGDEQRIGSARTDHSGETFKHVLLPVWSAAYRYSGKSYRFVVNGQSGRVEGERPWSIWKLTVAIIAALIALAVFLFVAQQSGYVRFDSNGFSPGDAYIIQGY
ncbi:zinc ribbon domain-containing protein [Paracoccus sediminicola]|uniref:zinc ribbon domain-containing protein n=1 Tax=Paracoccus sediminicola TaxID=3017783 RepID=UPI0022F110FA|nr:zinc ribbon domain-containing protein [Paracoccus sediminicola]WBU58211.1 zinc ribbon domain-containing protein [Paracoccus sediminicola]